MLSVVENIFCKREKNINMTAENNQVDWTDALETDFGGKKKL